MIISAKLRIINVENSMKKRFSIFIDESGTPDPKTFTNSPYYILNGLVISEEQREKMKSKFEKLKISYFGSKNHVIHAVDIKRELKHKKRSLDSFASGFYKEMSNVPFFLLTVVVDKEKANRQSWLQSTVLQRTSRALFDSLIKFLTAKDANGSIIVEASDPSKDLEYYKSFFHFCSNGIDDISISPTEVKKHITSLAFVTKLNNDPEEQLADLFAYGGRLKMQIDNGGSTTEQLDSIDMAIYNLMEKRLFAGTAKTRRKTKLYNAINSFLLLP